MFSRRLSIYIKLGCIPYSNISEPYEKILYDESDFLETLISDITKAKNEIVFSVSYILPSEITKKIFSVSAQRKISVYLRGKTSRENFAIENENKRMLSEYGLNMTIVNNPKNYIVIDRYISWYGEMNILGQSKRNISDKKSVMRIIDKDTAYCLLEDDEMLV